MNCRKNRQNSKILTETDAERPTGLDSTNARLGERNVQNLKRFDLMQKTAEQTKE